MASLSACWDWKVEPVSPDFISPDSETDAWSLEDDVTCVSPKYIKEDELTQTKSAAQLLDDLDEWIKEEPFANWLEEKIDLPIFEDIPASAGESRAYGHFVRGNNEAVKLEAATGAKNASLQPQLPFPNETQALLQEFESVYGEVEQNNGTLTPPQSPVQTLYSRTLSPQPEAASGSPQILITTLHQMIPVYVSPDDAAFRLTSTLPAATYSEKKDTASLIPNLEQIVPSIPAPDLAEELAAVDELVRSRVEALETAVSVPADAAVWLSQPEAATVVASSFTLPQQLLLAPPSPSSSSSSGEELGDDPDWVPEPEVHGPAANGPAKSSSCSRKRAKPYERVGNEEKRLRKKEQNKNAATRYRQKKKAEVEEILGEEKQLEDKNEELQAKVNDLAREIKYLKGLMRDVFKAKGLLK